MFRLSRAGQGRASHDNHILPTVYHVKLYKYAIKEQIP